LYIFPGFGTAKIIEMG